MVISAKTLITTAFRDIGIVKMNEPVDSTALTNALTDLNMLVDALGATRLMAPATVKEAFVLTGGKRTYTIGPNADFSTSKPWRVTSAYITDQMNNVYPVAITDQAVIEVYEDALITQTRPDEIAYDAGPGQQTVQWGLITCYPIPDSLLTYTLYLQQVKPFTEFAALSDTVSFPSSYYLTLRYSLAEILWLQYPRQGDDPQLYSKIHGKAVKWTGVVTAVNTKPGMAAIELGRKNKGYNINTGPYGSGD